MPDSLVASSVPVGPNSECVAAIPGGTRFAAQPSGEQGEARRAGVESDPGPAAGRETDAAASNRRRTEIDMTQPHR
ncbi:hypothetical protein NCAST_21_00910 [Nocardia asteroides NBRC 15531]|uniref:Uncharacterized protein n=1 Tax=Nocardia asteroides NBRC 15531 TaxID=1110697 RepID=U5ECM5_NOCAS|nr:hypothetical protein NCAST_21_00910 [Nocardia asteroides NBRC 15531]